MFKRRVGYAGLISAAAIAAVLITVIARNPETHDNLSRELREGYDRTPLDAVVAADLSQILADLPEFSFPERTRVVRSTNAEPPAADTGQAHERGDEGDSGAEPSNTTPPETQTVTLHQSEYEFDPDRLELEVGVPTELTVVNEGDQVHGIWIPEFAISEDIRSGKTKTFTFTPEEKGRIRFECSYNLCGTEEEHARMKGFITVK